MPRLPNGIHVSNATFQAIFDVRKRISGPAFLPSDLSNLGGWWRSDLGITLNGSDVSQWDDQSGNGVNFTQPTAAYQPAYSASGGPGSKPCVQFNAPDLTFMSSVATSLYSLSTGYTFFIVLKVATGGSDGLAVDTDTDSFGVQQFSGNFLARWNGGGYSQAPQTGTTWKYYSVKFDGGGATNADKMKTWINGAAQTLTFAGSAPASLNASSRWDIGRFSVGGYNLTGDIAEIIAYTDEKSDADRQTVESYLASRYGL